MTIKTLSRRITNDLSFEILLPEQSLFYHIKPCVFAGRVVAFFKDL